MLDSIDDDYEKWLIERELKKLKKLQKKYYVPSVLELDLHHSTKNEEEKKSSLEKSSNLLVKRLQKDK